MMTGIPGHETMILRPRDWPYEATVITLADGSVAMFYDLYEGSRNGNSEPAGLLHMQISNDVGRTWSEPLALHDRGGCPIQGTRTSPIRLRSGKLGLIHTGEHVRPGRDGNLIFHYSEDEGQTWSDGVTVDPEFAVLRSACGRVLSTGRIVAPVFKWISPDTGEESEEPSCGICFSWAYYSDDEGQTWQQSHSELIVAKNEGREGVYHFEEPVVEELRDGSLIMYGRTETGRHYVSYSKDGAITWTPPVPGPVLTSYTPTLLQRIPSTGHLLMVWNQSSPAEFGAGLSRHRLTCALSKDDGQTWTHFKNLESLDDRTQLDPPPAEPLAVYRGCPHKQPSDTTQYARAPGPIRVCYPSVTFVGDEVVVVYDCDETSSYELGSEMSGLHGTKMRVVPLDWFYQ